MWAGGRTCCAGGSTYCISGDDGDNVAQRNLQLDNYRAAHRSRRDVFNNWLGIEVTSGCHLAPAPLRLGGACGLRERTPRPVPRPLPAPLQRSLHTPPLLVSYELTSSTLTRVRNPSERDYRRATSRNKGYVYFTRLEIKRWPRSDLIIDIM